MPHGTENQQADTGNNTNDAAQSQVPATDTGADAFDANIEKHLDIAIEAQDGKKDDEPAKTAEAKPAESGKANEPADSTGSASNDEPQSGKAADRTTKPDEVSEAARTLNRAKDLKLADGTTVKGGAERRFYEQRETARQERDHFKKQFETTASELEKTRNELNTIKSSVESLRGADPRAVEIGAKIVGDMQRDPIGTLKKLVAEAAAQGYNTQDLGVGIDAEALKRMLDERLPSKESEPTDEELLIEAQKEAAAFYGQYPDARTHDTLLAAMLRDHPGLELHSAYFQLKNAFAEKDFDWSLSLEDNLKQQSDPNNSGVQNNQTNQQDNTNKGGTPLPGGRGADVGDFKLKTDGAAHEDLDTSEIVKQAMRENGLNI